MDKFEQKQKNKNIFEIAIILIMCVTMLLFDAINVSFIKDVRRNSCLVGTMQQLCGSIAVILLMKRLKMHVFSKVENLLFLLPCLIIAIDNFPFYSYFSGNMQFIPFEIWDVLLFLCYCICIGVFEECVFRGILFSVLAEHFGNNRKGFLKTYVVSSLVFGLAHLFNLFAGAGIGPTLLQVGYTILTGGLFCFAFIKTKNILCAAGVHAVYNFCGLLLSEQGIGTGIVFDLGTTLTMLIVSVLVGGFILYKVWKYPENERITLYERIGVRKCNPTDMQL